MSYLLSEADRLRVKRLADKGLSSADIALHTGYPLQYVGTILARRNEDVELRKAIRRLVTVKDPEAYLQSKGVWYA